VKWCKEKEHRSTSVGDVIVQNGKAWLVSWMGFTEIVEQKAKPQPLRE
jgi:hypothetical protein